MIEAIETVAASMSDRRMLIGVFYSDNPTVQDALDKLRIAVRLAYTPDELAGLALSAAAQEITTIENLFDDLNNFGILCHSVLEHARDGTAMNAELVSLLQDAMARWRAIEPPNVQRIVARIYQQI